MASSGPNYEEELKKPLEIYINFIAFMEKAKLDPGKYSISEQSMNTYSRLTREMVYKAKDAENCCRDYLSSSQPSLLRPTRGRVLHQNSEDLIITQPDDDKEYANPTDSGIDSSIITEESGEVEEKEVARSTGVTEQSEA